MKPVSWLAGGAALSTYAQIVLGATVRSSESGLGCPDWPTCHGGITPPLRFHPILEYSHRAVGTLTGVLILAACLAAWYGYRQRAGALTREARPSRRWRAQRDRAVAERDPETTHVVRLTTAALGLVIFEGMLGGAAVLLAIPGDLIAVHLTIALVILALLLLALVSSRPAAVLDVADGRGLRSFFRLALWTALAILVVVISGAIVVSSGATEHCDGWPYCQGGFTIVGGPLVIVQVVHRTLAGLAALLILVTAIRAIRRFAGVRPLAVLGWVLLGGVGLEVVMGAGLALLDQPELLKVIHVALATALWSAGVLACAFAVPRGKPCSIL